MKWKVGIILCVVSFSSLLFFGKPILKVDPLNIFMIFDLVVGSVGIGMMI